MGLLNLTTDLKSLRFGRDRKQDGSSGQPYIVSPIPTESKPNYLSTGGPDSILRGGLLAPISAFNDMSRLTKMFFDLKSPQGLLFIGKENVLSRTAVKTQASWGAGTAGGNVNAGVYLPTSTIAQALVGFTGTHLNLLGLDPTGLSPLAIKTYTEVVKNLQSNEENRLVLLNRAIQIGDSITLPHNTGTVNNPDVSILTYGGGPGSILGIGKTNIQYADQRTGAQNAIATSFPEYFYVGSRPNDKTKDDWISPITKGASSAYLDATGGDLFDNPLTFPDGKPVVTADGGFGYVPNFGYANLGKVYQSGSLNAQVEIADGTYQTSRWSGRTTGSFISPVAGGVSSVYDAYTLETIPTNLTTGSYNYTQDWNYSTTNSGSLSPIGNIDTYQTKRWSGRTTGSYIDPIPGGASSMFTTYTGDAVNVGVTSGSYGWTQNYDISTTQSGSLLPIGNISSYQMGGIGGLNTANDPRTTPINYRKLVSLSNIFADLATSENIDPNDPFAVLFNENMNFINDAGEKFNTNNYSVYDNDLSNASNPLTKVNYTQTFAQEEFYNYTIGGKNYNGPNGTNLNPQDFRKYIIEQNEIKGPSKVLALSPNYKTKYRGRRVNSGDPGASNTANGQKNVFNYGIPANEAWALDKINAMPMYDSRGPDVSKGINDLVKFRIAAINNDKHDGTAVYMHFRAFLDSFSDAYSAAWTPTKYVGRGESMYTYGGFNRQISLGFTAYAQSKAELIPMYKKLNYLASTLAPDHTSAGFMRGNLVRLTIGGYLYEQPGFINSLTYSIPQNTTWEIGLNEEGGTDSSVKELPHMISVTGFSFTPIHTFLPQKPNNANNPNERYIALANKFNSRGNYADDYRSYNASSTADIPGEGESN